MIKLKKGNKNALTNTKLLKVLKSSKSLISVNDKCAHIGPNCLHLQQLYLVVDLHTPISTKAQLALCEVFASQDLSFLGISLINMFCIFATKKKEVQGLSTSL